MPEKCNVGTGEVGPYVAGPPRLRRVSCIEIRYLIRKHSHPSLCLDFVECWRAYTDSVCVLGLCRSDGDYIATEYSRSAETSKLSVLQISDHAEPSDALHPVPFVVLRDGG